MITIKGNTWSAILLSACVALISFQAQATSVYQWTTDGHEGDGKWDTRNYHNTDGEHNDGSGKDPWDINFMGVGIAGGQFHVRAEGGSILQGSNYFYQEMLELGDIAINVFKPGEMLKDPADDSTGWDYALKLLGVDNGHASFDLYALGDDGYWTGSGKGATVVDDGKTIYQHENYAYGSTQTWQMQDGDKLNKNGVIKGTYSDNGGDNNVLEVSFDLSLLSLFNEQTGGRIITYLTMSCVNDEAIVDANVSPVPVPSAVWLFGSALIGFIGMSRRTRV